MFSSPNLKYFTTTTDEINQIISDSRNFGPSYYKAVCDLFEKVKYIVEEEKIKDDKQEQQAKTVELEQKVPFFIEFARKYTMIPSIWLFWYKTECIILYTTCTPREHIHFKSPEVDRFIFLFLRTTYCSKGKHYYADCYDNDRLVRSLNSDHYDSDLILLREMLHLPHAGMEKLFNIFDKYAADNKTNYPKGKEYAIKKYEAALNLYKTLKDNEQNAELWIKYLKETKDKEFITTSCEYRLGKNPENQEFWFRFLQYLKECGNIGMLLKTYSRYSKLFLDDKSLHEKWFTELVEAKIDYGSFSWTVRDGSVSSHDHHDSFASFMNIIKRQKQYSCDSNNDISQTSAPIPSKLAPAIQQVFALPKDTIEHVAKTASSLSLLKLQMTCKYFWYKNDTIYCHRLKFYHSAEQPIFLKNSLILPLQDVDVLKNYHIGQYLSIDHSQMNFALSSLIKLLLHSCCLRYLKISSQYLTLDEFEFLAGTKTLISFYMYDVVIKNGEKEMAKFEDVFELLPNVEIFTFETSFGRRGGIKYTTETAYRLVTLQRNVKLFYFRLDGISNDLDPKEFALFIKKNVAADARLILSWTEKEFKERSKPIIKDIVFGDKEFHEWNLKILFGYENFFDNR